MRALFFSISLLASAALAAPLLGPEWRTPAVNGQAAEYQGPGAVASDGSGWLSVWVDRRGAESVLYGARLSASGTVLDPEGFVINATPGSKGSVAVT